MRSHDGRAEAVRGRLAAARDRVARLQAEVAGVQAASRDTNADDEHDPEGATIAFERQQLVALLDDAHASVAGLQAAMGRLETGRYGVCERCGAAIAPGRLAARPAATTCIDCARR